MFDFPQLAAEVLTGVVTGIQVNERDFPLTSLVAGTGVDVLGDTATWDVKAPNREIVKSFEGRFSPATPTDPPTSSRKASSMLHSHKRRSLRPEEFLALRRVGGSSADLDRALTNIDDALADMDRRYRREPMEYLIAGALQDNISITVQGVAVTPDFGLAAGHDLTAAASWGTATTDIDSDVETIKRVVVQDSGMMPSMVLCGRNIFGYLRKNTAVKSWLTNFAGADERYRTLQGERIDNLFGMTWMTLRHGWTVSGTWTPVVPDDVCIFIPPVSKSWFQVHNGLVMYPTAVYGGLDTLGQTFGVATWLRMGEDPITLHKHHRWASLPILVFPSALVRLDTTP